ncbi:MAG: 50S ribosomal protein L3 [Thermotogae bacterium]|jgi:large subunit ribosomal protein L3|uniref:50S ribosomal protein L3 n=1 Tax=Athalassotoga sp. TaxID=2022597 RepID=UPI003D034699|nr:50S ribosomal protein L3 [Thermotogota bacterium]
MKALLGKKIGMTMIFKDGHAVPVTVLKAGPCVVVQKKTVESDGYNSVQIGFEPVTEKHVTKPMRGHFKKANVSPLRHLKEIRTDDVASYQIGQTLDVSVFNEGDYVDISGKTKGKGFQGAVKRWNFGGHDKTHGTKFPRHGSTGMHTEPAKVLKGTHMAGHMGDVNRTISNLKVVRVDKDNSLIAVKGAIPGARGSLIYISSAKNWKVK